MQRSHAGKQRYKNALSFYPPHPTPTMLVPQRPSSVFPSKSLSALRVCEGKTIFPVNVLEGPKRSSPRCPRWQKKKHLHPIFVQHCPLVPTPTPPHPPRCHVFYFLFLTFASDIFHRLPPCTVTCSRTMQIVDLFIKI